MRDARMILIAAPELIPALRERVGEDDEIVTFADSEPLRALEAIAASRPPVVALERLFAASPRGAALIARIKADPSLSGSEIRVLSHDSDYQRVSPRRNSQPRPAAPSQSGAAPVAVPLDKGTRRAPRFRMREATPLTVDDQPAQLVDLSVVGAQLLSKGLLRPRQRVTLAMGSAAAGVVVEGEVIWARLELSQNGPAYRAGVEFARPDSQAIAAFIDAHRQA